MTEEQQQIKLIVGHAQMVARIDQVTALRTFLLHDIEQLKGTKHEAHAFPVEPNAGHHFMLAYDKLMEVIEALEDGLTELKN